MGDADLRAVFDAFCAFGDRTSAVRLLTSDRFAKLCRDCNVLDDKVTPSTVDITFEKLKVNRKLDYPGFRTALTMLAALKYPELESQSEAFETLRSVVVQAGGPIVKATVSATDTSVFAKLTDASQYSGTQRHKFGVVAPVARGGSYRVESGPAVSGAGAGGSSPRPAVGSPRARALSPRGALKTSPRKQTSSGSLPRAGSGRPPSSSSTMWDVDERTDAKFAGDVRTVFRRYCGFSHAHGTGDGLDVPSFIRLVHDCGLDDRGLTRAQAEEVFLAVKQPGATHLAYTDFLLSLDRIEEPHHQRLSVLNVILHHLGAGGIARGRVAGSPRAPGSPRDRTRSPRPTSTSPRRTSSPHSHDAPPSSLRQVFKEYVLYGATLDARTRDESDMTMDSALFMKMAKEAGLVGRVCTPADVDVIFSKVKTPGLRKIGFEEFEMALALIGMKLYPDNDRKSAMERVSVTVVAHGAPETRATAVEAHGIYDKLTDEALYTGAHRHRFGLESEGVESPRARRVSDRPTAPPPPDYRTGDLEEVFDRFCNFGASEVMGQLDSTRMGKLARDCGIVGTYAKNLGEVDVMFAKVKGTSQQRITFGQFRQLLMILASEGMSEASPELAYTSIVDKIVDHGAPDIKATVPTTAGVFDKLTDTQQYTGAHRARFGMEHTTVPEASPRAAIPPGLNGYKSEDLLPIFEAYASFGGTAVLSDIDSAKFAKLAKEAGLCEGKLSLAAVDVAFSKAKSKGARRLAFREFENAIGLLGMEKFPGLEYTSAYYRAADMIIDHGGPETTSTRPEMSAVYEKLTDVDQYTGAHRARFGQDAPSAGTFRGNYRTEALRHTFELYSSFGGGDGTSLQRFKFHKVLREAGILSSARLNVDDIDAAFSKCVGGLGTPADVCMRFRDFERGLSLIAERVHPGVADKMAAYKMVVDRVVTSGGPRGSEDDLDAEEKLYRDAAAFHKDALSTRLRADVSPRAQAQSASAAPTVRAVQHAELSDVFAAYNSFGGGDPDSMDNVKFAKLARDSGLTAGVVTKSDIDVIFTKVKEVGERRIDIAGFEKALLYIAIKMFPMLTAQEAYNRVVGMVVTCGPPRSSGTVPDVRSTVFDKLTDSAQYTGAHKQRFASLPQSGAGGSPRASAGLLGEGSASPRSSYHAGTPTSRRDPGTLRGSPSAASDDFGRAKERRPAPTANDRALKAVFQAFCGFGGGSSGSVDAIDNFMFAKLIRECDLLSSRFTNTDVDIIFSQAKTKGSRKLTFSQFKEALHLVAARRFPDVDPSDALEGVVSRVIASGGPEARATVTDMSGVFSKMTDASLYTGAHKHRAHYGAGSGDGV